MFNVEVCVGVCSETTFDQPAADRFGLIVETDEWKKGSDHLLLQGPCLCWMFSWGQASGGFSPFCKE